MLYDHTLLQQVLLTAAESRRPGSESADSRSELKMKLLNAIACWLECQNLGYLRLQLLE